jgi:hypothetical protein
VGLACCRRHSGADCCTSGYAKVTINIIDVIGSGIFLDVSIIEDGRAVDALAIHGYGISVNI